MQEKILIVELINTLMVTIKQIWALEEKVKWNIKRKNAIRIPRVSVKQAFLWQKSNSDIF